MKKFFITLSMMLFVAASNLSAQEITPGKAVDLGLPSGTIWAGWNVGATSPEEYGDYYAWGETEVKSDYSWDTYKYYNYQKGYIYIGTSISFTKYDVARQKWGGLWRMPTKTDIDELVNNCIWLWYQYKGVNGYKITGPNGNSIFLPTAGYCNGVSPIDDGSIGGYWSASLLNDLPGHAYYLKFSNGSYDSDYYSCRDFGRSVRPVI